MIAQRVSTLVTLLLLPLAMPAYLSASVVTHNRNTAVHALPGRSAEATMQVTNDNGQTVNVILVGGQGWYVLGLVGSKATRVFDVPSDLVGMRNVKVWATPLDDVTGFQSEGITIRPGREVELVVTSPAAQSLLTVG